MYIIIISFSAGGDTSGQQRRWSYVFVRARSWTQARPFAQRAPQLMDVRRLGYATLQQLALWRFIK
jgi:hypothetical protein